MKRGTDESDKAESFRRPYSGSLRAHRGLKGEGLSLRAARRSVHRGGLSFILVDQTRATCVARVADTSFSWPQGVKASRSSSEFVGTVDRVGSMLKKRLSQRSATLGQVTKRWSVDSC